MHPNKAVKSGDIWDTAKGYAIIAIAFALLDIAIFYFYVLGQLSQSHIAITTINFYIYDTASGQTAAAGMGQGFNASLGAIEVVPVIVTPHRNISVEDFAIGPGDFSILGVSPSLPRDVPYGTNDTFVLELKLPYESYYGPINITYSIG